MKTLNILTQPYNDDVLEFNEITGRYQLTLQYVKTLRDVMPYKNDGVAKQRIKQNSQTVYKWIVNHGNSVNRSVVDFMLNRTEEGRKFLIEALTSQIEADMEYAYNDLSRRPVINSQTGQEGNRDVFRENSISLETENVIDDAVAYFGFNLCILVPFDWSLFDLLRKYGG